MGSVCGTEAAEEPKESVDEAGGVKFATPGSGLSVAYLARVKVDVPVIPRIAEDSDPAFNDTIDKFRESVTDEKTLARLRNKVKVCAACKKPCAISLKTCNACGTSLEDVPVSFNDNIFMGFVYGIAKGKFPYKISMRYQDSRFMCFDDPLAMSPMHFNVVPTDVYIPDWRFLFLDPAKGLKLVTEMFDIAAKIALEQFWSNEEFRKRIFKGEEKPKTPKDIMDVTCCGVNFPPSMYQLHLQFIHMPLTPFHYNQAKQEGHWHYGRFFPLEYVMQALALGSKVKMKVTEDTDIQEIMNKVHAAGVVYDSVHRVFLNKCWALQERFAPWVESDFECQVVNGNVYNMATGRMEPDSDAKAIQGADAKKLQNYGRPYDDDGKISGTYYKYAKKTSDVKDFK